MSSGTETSEPFDYSGPWPDNSKHPESVARGSSMGQSGASGGNYGGGSNEG